MVIMGSGQQIIVGNGSNDFHSFPDTWKLCSFGDITVFSQYGISSSSGGNYSVPILKMNNLQDGQIDLGDLDCIHLSKAELESLILKEGDLLINRTNSIDLVGKAAVYNLSGEHVFASYLVRFRLSPSVLPAFVNYFLNSEPGQRKLKLLATKAVSQANINPSILKRQLFVPVPPLAEQIAIAAVLGDVDALITSLNKLIAKKRDIKQATMQQLLTGRIRLPGFSEGCSAKYKKTEFGMIPADWELVKIGDYAFVTKLAGFEYTHHFDYRKSGPIIAIRALNIKDGKLDLTDVHTIPRETSKFLSRSQLAKGDLVISYVGTLGRVAVVPENDKFHLAPNVAKIRVNFDRVDPFYLSQSLNGEIGQQAIFKVAASTTQAALSMQNLRDVPFILPSLSEQQAIATVLSDMDSEITALEQKRDKYRALKQAMMQELLTGKTRLT